MGSKKTKTSLVPLLLLLKDLNHLILDFENKTPTSSAWSLNFISENIYQRNVILNKKNIFKNLNDISDNNIHTNFKKFALKDMTYPSVYSNNLVNTYFARIKNVIQRHIVKLESKNPVYIKNNDLFKLVNINFLRKERLYTKLKYSRSPAYDIVSGGAAALLAGFIGFLISEKYGFELVDSGDFYYLFMYGVWAAFSLRPLLVSISLHNSIYTLFSLKFILNFYKRLLFLILNKIKF